MNKFDDSEYPILIIDVNNVFVQQYMGNDYRSEEGIDLSGVYGTLKNLNFLISRFLPTFVICVFDGKGGSSKKRKLFPEYKKNKGMPVKVNYKNGFQLSQKYLKDSKENFVFQLRLLHEFLSYLPIHRVVAEGCEADEIIGYVCKNYMVGSKKLIVSNDKDFHQLLSDEINIYDNKNRVIRTKEYVKEFWKINNINSLTLLRAILGDASDKIPGIYSIKTKSIENYFPDFLERFDINTVDEFVNYLIERKSIYETGKKEIAPNWKTIVGKINIILEGKDENKVPYLNILKRNFELMQLTNPDISVDKTILIQKYLNVPVGFQSSNYKAKIVSEGLQIEGNNLWMWESNFREMVYRQKQYNLQG